MGARRPVWCNQEPDSDLVDYVTSNEQDAPGTLLLFHRGILARGFTRNAWHQQINEGAVKVSLFQSTERCRTVFEENRVAASLFERNAQDFADPRVLVRDQDFTQAALWHWLIDLTGSSCMAGSDGQR